MQIDLQLIREFNRIDLLAKQLVEGFITGLHKSPYHGFSVEFAEHRLYNTGESTKNIDWKVFARTDKLFTKRYEEETNLRCSILIDTSSSMYYPIGNNGKITFSIMAAAALSYLLHKQRDAVGLTTFSDQIELQTPTKSTASHLHKVYLELDKLMKGREKSETKSIPSVLHQIAQKVHKRSLVIIFSDMFDNYSDPQEILTAMHHLKHNQHEVLLFHVTDHETELDFEFDHRPHEFIDLETGEKVRLQPQDIQKQFQSTAQKYYNDLKYKCGDFKIDFIEADIKDDFDKILSAYLIKRAKMK